MSMKQDDYWIDKGHCITCDRGHVIATARESTAMGLADPWMDKLDWVIEKPEEGSVTPCPVCGALWFFKHTETVQWNRNASPLRQITSWICVDGEWHPPLWPSARDYVDEFAGANG